MLSEVSLKKFEEINHKTKFCYHGILPSEAFLICALCDHFDIKMFIESGVAHGRSTEFWGYYLTSIPILAIEKAVIKPEVKNKCIRFPNIKLVQGDALNIIPQTINESKVNMGIMLDGPKGQQAIDLALSCLRNSSYVKFVGIHDMHFLGRGHRRPGDEQDKSSSRIAMEKANKSLFFSDENWFVEKYKHLDSEEQQSDHEICWRPYQYTKNGKVERKLGSYGPTIGVMFNESIAIHNSI